MCILRRKAPTWNSAHPNWHLTGHGRLACSQVPTAALRAYTPGTASIIHCVLFINNPSSHLPPSPTHRHTHKHTPPSSPPAAHPYLHFPSFIILTFWSNVSLGAEPTACWTDGCPTCHCWRNKGVRCDTCPCYTPLCIFDVSAFPPGQRSVSDKLHTIGNTFLNIVQEAAAISQASLKLPIVTQNFIFIMSLFSIMRLWGKFCPC